MNFPDSIPKDNYVKLRSKILEDDSYIQNLIKSHGDKDKTISFARDLLHLMFSSISMANGSYVSKIIAVLFNAEKMLNEQFLGIEATFKEIDKLFNKFEGDYLKSEFLDIISTQLKIDDFASIQSLVAYANSVNHEALRSKETNFNNLLKLASNKIINEHFDLFKFIINLFLQNESQNINSLVQYLSSMLDKAYSNDIIKKVLNYCADLGNFDLANNLSAIKTSSKKAKNIIESLTQYDSAQISLILESLGESLSKLLKVVDIKKVKILLEITIDCESLIDPAQYSELITKANQSDLDYIKLVGSYLKAKPTAKLSKENIIDMVFSHLDMPSALQDIFAKNNLERFEYNEQKIRKKIAEIFDKNQIKQLNIVMKNKIFDLFESIILKAAEYANKDVVELQAIAIDIKHSRMLKREHSKEEILKFDVDFIALMLEMLYRSEGMFPRDNQVLSLLFTLLNENHIIQEVATGQGKSIITALHAAYLWYSGQTVDVVTANRYLAAKDLADFSDFFDMLNIPHSQTYIKSESHDSEYVGYGINYSTAADIALFRANKDFTSLTYDPSLNNAVSIVCDEVDFTITADINYRLSAPLFDATSDQIRVLFGYILQFTESDAFRNTNVSSEDDVENFRKFIHHQFRLHKMSYKYPLSQVQLMQLNKENPALHMLHEILGKIDQNFEQLIDLFLNSALASFNLKEGVDFVLPKIEDHDQFSPLAAIPLVKSQPMKGTIFGDGIHIFVHLLLERSHPELAGKFSIMAPTETLFNISPKNLFDYYHRTGGRIIGLTGTAGSLQELEEFRNINKMLAVSIPRHEQDLKKISSSEVNTENEQYDNLLKIINKAEVGRPILIFCENTVEAEKLYSKLSISQKQVQLCAASMHDTNSLEETVAKAGYSNYITITTPMMGRGTDFYTENRTHGFLAINLCTDIIPRTLEQMGGRVARNGFPGEIISIFNQEKYRGFSSINDAMSNNVEQEAIKRAKNQPLTDILQYFNIANRDNSQSAILCIKEITQYWRKISSKVTEAAGYKQLRSVLVEFTKNKYPNLTTKLDDYLISIDSGVPEAGVVEKFGKAPIFNIEFSMQDQTDIHIYQLTDKPMGGSIDKIARSYAKFYLNVTPNILTPDIIQQYTYILRSHNIILATHILTLEQTEFHLVPAKALKFNEELVQASQSGPSSQYVTAAFSLYSFFVSQDKNDYELLVTEKFLYSLFKSTKISKLKVSEELREYIYDNSADLKFSESQIIELTSSISQSGQYRFDSSKVSGEGSIGYMMLDELKIAFKNYASRNDSKEVGELEQIINQAVNVRELNIDKMVFGKYQVISIETTFGIDHHIETIVTDGKFLYWINRGASYQNGAPGIKLFKVIKDFDYVKTVLENLRYDIKEEEAIKLIYSLLTEKSIDQDPRAFVDINHIDIAMKAQVIGNCGWTQRKGIVKILSIIHHIGELNDLPDIDSQKWQNALKNSDDIYRDFTTFHRLLEIERLLYQAYENFQSIFLTEDEKLEVNATKDLLKTSLVNHELLNSVMDKLDHTMNFYNNTIYEKQAKYIQNYLHYQIAIESKFGANLIKSKGFEKASLLIKAFFQHGHQFEELEQIEDVELSGELLSVES